MDGRMQFMLPFPVPRRKTPVTVIRQLEQWGKYRPAMKKIRSGRTDGSPSLPTAAGIVFFAPCPDPGMAGILRVPWLWNGRECCRQSIKNGYSREGISVVSFFRKNVYCCGLLRRNASRASPARLKEAAAGSGTLRAAICSALSTPWYNWTLENSAVWLLLLL